MENMDETKQAELRVGVEKNNIIQNLYSNMSDEASVNSRCACNKLKASTAIGNIEANGKKSEVPTYVYAMGRIEPRFPSISVEKEFAQATGRAVTAGLTDRQMLHDVLTNRANRYLLRQMCWVMTIEGLETYILVPRVSEDIDLLAEAIRPNPSQTDVDVVIGVKGPIAPPGMCNGLMVPFVAFDQIYSFDENSLIKSIPKPAEIADEKFGPVAKILLDRILQVADNAGATDEHRALNYLAMRYSAIYNSASEMFERDYSLAGVDIGHSRLSGVRKVVSVIFSYVNRKTDVTEKYFVRVDVTDEFPFLVTKLAPYFDR